MMRKWTILWIAFSVMSVGGCTKKKEPSPKLLDLQKRVKLAAEELKSIEVKLKAAPATDLGLSVKLAADKELAQARHDRLQVQFGAAQKAEGVVLETPAGGEGGHGGGAPAEGGAKPSGH